MDAAYCYEGIPLRFLASLFDIQMRYLVYRVSQKNPKTIENDLLLEFQCLALN